MFKTLQWGSFKKSLEIYSKTFFWVNSFLFFNKTSFNLYTFFQVYLKLQKARLQKVLKVYSCLCGDLLVFTKTVIHWAIFQDWDWSHWGLDPVNKVGVVIIPITDFSNWNCTGVYSCIAKMERIFSYSNGDDFPNGAAMTHNTQHIVFVCPSKRVHPRKLFHNLIG